MRTPGIVWLLAGLGCGKGGGPALTTSVSMNTPRATADGVMRATRERNPMLAGTLLAPEATIRAHLDCPDDALAKRITARRAKLDAEFGQAPRETLVEIARFDKLGTQERQLRKGDTLEGCASKGLIQTHLSKLELRASTGDKSEFRDDTWLFVQFGDDPTWYWVP